MGKQPLQHNCSSRTVPFPLVRRTFCAIVRFYFDSCSLPRSLRCFLSCFIRLSQSHRTVGSNASHFIRLNFQVRYSQCTKVNSLSLPLWLWIGSLTRARTIDCFVCENSIAGWCNTQHHCLAMHSTRVRILFQCILYTLDALLGFSAPCFFVAPSPLKIAFE